MPTVADVVGQAIARERARCAAIMQEEADILLGSGDWQTAQLLERVANRFSEDAPASATVADPSVATSAAPADDDEADFQAMQAQVSARVFGGSGYGKD